MRNGVPGARSGGSLPRDATLADRGSLEDGATGVEGWGVGFVCCNALVLF